MQAHQISIKLWFEPSEDLDAETFIPVFHAWIREQKLGDEVMIDVADYAHVPDGPAVLLVCHEGHYVVEHAHGRWALAYHRKRGDEQADLSTRLQTPLRRLVVAARLLEGEPTLAGKLRFDTSTLELSVRNRLAAPNTEQTWVALQPDLQSILQPVLGPHELIHENDDPRTPFTVTARPENPPPLSAFAPS